MNGAEQPGGSRAQRHRKRAAIFIVRFTRRAKLTWTLDAYLRWRIWYRNLSRNHPWRYRVLNLVALLLFLTGTILPVIQAILTDRGYALSPAARSLVGDANTKLAEQLKWDSNQAAWTFNGGAPDSSNLPGGSGAASVIAAMRAQVGAASGKQSDKSTYALTLFQDPKKGITYTDTNTGLSFTMVPQFSAQSGQIVDNHLVYPLPGGLQAIYTVKGNGLKEDIFVPTHAEQRSQVDLHYTLQLPKTLEARGLPDGSGGIGVYGADPTLFSNVQAGQVSDQEALEKARENGAKTNLTFVLPAPNITVPQGANSGSTSARFELQGSQLTVTATNLDSLKSPASIDPSVVVTSASDFQTNGNNEGMIGYDTGNNMVQRNSFTGGNVFSTGWSSTNSLANYGLSAGHLGVSAVAYNGYLYALGGTDGTGNPEAGVEYAPIAGNGSLSSAWHFTHNSGDDGTSFVAGFSTARLNFGAVAYNGYLYVYGGNDGGTNFYNTVEYAPINSNGTVGTWNTTSSFITGRWNFGSAAYNGYLYLLGGGSGSGSLNDVQYAPFNGNGTLGAWHYTHNSTDDGTTFVAGFTTARSANGAVAYNGYLYVMGGQNSGGTTVSDVQYAPLNANGTVGTWASTTSMSTALYYFATAVYNGYLYIFGGQNSGGTNQNAVYYAPINANGTLPTWSATSSFTTARNEFGAVAYGNTLYIVGGYSGSYLSDTQYAIIDPAGQLASFTSTTALPTATKGVGVAYNGYIYQFGGYTTNTTTNTTGVWYGQLNGDGTVASWTSTTAQTASVASDAVVAYNGCMYMIGGQNYNANPSAVNTIYYTTIGSSGALGGSWTTSGITLPSARTGLAAAAYNGKLYIVGGLSGTSPSFTNNTDIQYINLNSNCSLSGSWSNPSVSFSGAQEQLPSLFMSGNRMYLLGGRNAAGTYSSNVSYLTINSSGVPSSWSSTTALPNGMIWLGNAGVVNGTIYIWTGWNGAFHNDLWFAPIAADGTVGSWTETPAIIGNAGGNGESVVSYNGYIYVYGGQISSTAGSGYTTNDVDYARINNGRVGTVGSWSTTTTLASARYEDGSVAYNGYLYQLGGYDGSSYLSDTRYAAISTGGSLGSWTNSSNTFTTGRQGLDPVAYNGYLYVVGGSGSSGGLHDIQYAAINSNGSLGSFTTATTTIAIARIGASTVAYNGYMYVIGGSTGGTNKSDVQYAAINSDGSLGSFSSTASFTNARYGMAVVAYNGYMYLIGGYDGTNFYNDIQYAVINSGGTLGSWAPTSSFTNARDYGGAVAYGGHLYIFGGTTASTYLNDVQVASINADGTVDIPTWTTNFATGRNQFGYAVADGYLYILGGLQANTNTACNASSSSKCSDVQYTSINAIARTGVYSKLIDLGSTVNVTGITYNGTIPNGASAVTYRAAGNNGVFGSALNANAASGSTGCLGNTTYTRYLFVSVTLDDTTGQGSSGGSFPDGANAPAYVTDFTINYNPVHPAPNIRLRGGQTLRSGGLSALDTCNP